MIGHWEEEGERQLRQPQVKQSHAKVLSGKMLIVEISGLNQAVCWNILSLRTLLYLAMHSSHYPANLPLLAIVEFLVFPRNIYQWLVPSESKVCWQLLLVAHWFFMSHVSHSWGEKRFFEFSHSQRPWADLCFHAGWNRSHRVISLGRPQIQLPCIPTHTHHHCHHHPGGHAAPHATVSCLLCLSSFSSGMFRSTQPTCI